MLIDPPLDTLCGDSDDLADEWVRKGMPEHLCKSGDEFFGAVRAVGPEHLTIVSDPSDIFSRKEDEELARTEDGALNVEARAARGNKQVSIPDMMAN